MHYKFAAQTRLHLHSKNQNILAEKTRSGRPEIKHV